MSNEGTNKRKRRKEAQKRQQRKLMMNGRVLLLLVVVIAVFVLGGCGSNYEADTNTVYLLKDGKIVSNSVESFDENVYSKDDFKNYIQELSDTYNLKHENAIKQKSLKIEDGEAVLVMEYANADVFEEFEGVEFFAGTITEAVAAGYTFEGEFANVADGKTVATTSEEFMNDTTYKVIVIKSNVTVSLEEGQICYVSAVNTESVKEGAVVIKEGANLLAEEVAEDTELLDATEIEGAISEEDLLIGTEEELIFDFGEEEEIKTPYSSVYTYIIYK